MKLLNHLDDEIELPLNVKLAYGELSHDPFLNGRVHRWYTSTQTAGDLKREKLGDLINGLLMLDKYIKDLIEARENVAKLIDQHLEKFDE